ncbi:MAG: bi-domain-containing oxidoreductase [Ignavibacteriales bacterium]|nr:bi-domain-containing oxidoreductase [Ignavibacteriales bacterium]
MKQLTQSLKDGAMQLLDTPFPSVSTNSILIRNYYSVISAGTEGKTVKDARLSYIGKAKARQEEVKKVINLAKSQGIADTYKTVMNKLDSPSPLGYSCAGEVIEVGTDVKNFKVGDLAACGGASAVHSEVVSVPINLAVKIKSPEFIKESSFATIGAIAMQGVRRADLKLGENCVVIGLGLIGQITMQLLIASGVEPIGIDIDNNKVELANNLLGNISYSRNRTDLEEIILEKTNGYGVDSIIITAASSSSDPIELAGRIARKKGKVVIVGAVPTGFNRANYYKKELDLLMSSSYGPGRYDSNYEDKGIDYPIGYVRWTENRNMESFVRLVENKKINISPLISHEFDFENAKDAYDLIISKKEPFTGIILKYDTKKSLSKKVSFEHKEIEKARVSVGFIGAGSFAQNFLLPNLKQKVLLKGVSTSRSNTSRNVLDKYGFSYSTSNSGDILEDSAINTIFIATRHNLHASLVIDALAHNKHIFVEKPLCMNESELQEISKLYNTKNNHLMVGFNRRFSPHIQKVNQLFKDDLPKAINYRINAGNVPIDHWVNDPEIGGGRIIGEVCHFIDLCQFIAGAKINNIHANNMSTANNLFDTLVINLGFENGSTASISYFSNGSKLLSKEYLEIFYAGSSAIIDDFKTINIYGSKKEKLKLSKQDKGHAEEVKQFVNSIENGLPQPIPFEEIYNSTLATFKVIESIENRQSIII